MSDAGIASAAVRASFSFIFRLLRDLAPFLALLTAACEQPTAELQPPQPMRFAGSEACRECHLPQYQLWQPSHHALAMQEATADTVLGDFSDVDFTYFGTTSRFFTRDGAFMVRTDNAAGELEEFEISYTFGVTPLQQYLIERPDGRLQALSIVWDSRAAAIGGQRWYHLYGDEFIGHDDPLHWTGREQNWNYMCAECHSTDLQKNYQPATDTFNSTWSEINVGCEACHGPGSRHIERARSGSPKSGLAVDLDDRGRSSWQMNPQTGIAVRSELLMRPLRQPEACGRCHARRSLASGDYEYGKPLDDTHTPSLLEPLLYFADGQILEEVYVYGSFLQSRMYQAGVSCSDCHDPHSARLRTQGAPSEVCRTCHLPQKFEAAEHHRHPESVQCVDCHMPARTYMGVDDRRDHSFRIPRPDLSITTGVPNACNQCHEARDARWAAAAIDEWYGDQRSEHFAEAIHAGRNAQPSANDRLGAVIGNDAFPGIVRATAMTLLQRPYSAPVFETIRRNLSNPDSLVRRAALGALAQAAPQQVVPLAVNLLRDPVRSVRIEAARVVSPLQAGLRPAYLAAFREANQERIAAQLAIAERPEAQLNLGNAYLEAGDYQAAEAALLRALTIEPLAAPARVNLADLYARSGRIGEAQALLRDGIEMQGESAVLHHALGLLMVRDGRQDAALAELERAARLQPDESRFVYVYAIALNSLGQGDQAIREMQDARQRFPGNFDIHFALATLLRDSGDVQQAREVAAELSRMYPQVDAVQNLLDSL
ncbi:MAG: tetratricopeptide repeat protein [Woeseiaceae bacterium]|nr:tetratricopeptide repeat protein [Woeseiaceae bacterium]